MTLKIEIAAEADRLAVAAVLIKNGYTVRQVREKDAAGRKWVYFVEATK